MSKLCNDICRKFKTPYLTENKIFKYRVEYELEDSKIPNNEVIEFLTMVLPKTEFTYYIYVDKTFEDGKRCCNIACNYDNYIDKLSRMTNMPYNIYFSVVSYNGWRCDEDVVPAYKSVYIDIDDLDCDITNMDKNELINLIAKRGSFENSDFNAVVKSGRGSHAYMCVDDIENEEVRKNLSKSLTYIFGADIACVAPSHFVRLPLSINAKKKDGVKTQLYIVNDQPYTMAQLDKYIADQTDIDDYFTTEQERINTKRLNTMAANKKLKGIALENNKQSVEQFGKNEVENTQLQYADYIDELITEDVNEYTANWLTYYESLYTNTRTWRYRELQAIKDLLIYLKRRNGMIEGYRNKFVLCFSSKAFNLFSAKKCVAILSELLPDYPYKEIESTVNSVYKKPKFKEENIGKTITNKHMSELLNFTKADIAVMNCNYSSNHLEKNYKRNKKYAQTKGKVFRNKKEYQKTVVLDNMNTMTNQELADLLDVSVSTVKRIKSDIKEKAA